MGFGHLINRHVFFLFFFLTRFHFSGANLVGSYLVISDSSKVREEWIIKNEHCIGECGSVSKQQNLQILRGYFGLSAYYLIIDTDFLFLNLVVF